MLVARLTMYIALPPPLRCTDAVAGALVGGVVVPERRLSAGSPWIDGRLAEPFLQHGFVHILSTICPAIAQSYSAVWFALAAAPAFSTTAASVQ